MRFDHSVLPTHAFTIKGGYSIFFDILWKKYKKFFFHLTHTSKIGQLAIIYPPFVQISL